MANWLPTRLTDLDAAVAFYGRAPEPDEAARIKTPMLIHYAENDERVNAGAAA
jgi:carboxymethylenebutenolidase